MLIVTSSPFDVHLSAPCSQIRCRSLPKEVSHSSAFCYSFAAVKSHRTALVSEIAIPNIDPPVFKSILEFLYTGTLELKVDTVFQIYKSADQYLLEDVKSACRSFINLSMTQEHALTLLENARSCKFMEIYQVILHIKSYRIEKTTND